MPLRKTLGIRPMAVWALMATAGALVGGRVELKGEIGMADVAMAAGWTLGIAAVAVGALVPKGRFLLKKRLIDAMICGVFLSVGIARGSDARVEFVMVSGQVEMSGEIVKIETRDSTKTRVVMEVEQSGNEMIKKGMRGTIYLKGDDGQDVKCGDEVRITGSLFTPRADPYSDFDYVDYLTNQGITFCANADSMKTVGRSGMSIRSLAGNVNEALSVALNRAGVSSENIGFLRALILADRSELSRETKAAFSDCGASHVLAVSGLHVGLLSAFVAWVMGLFVARRWAVLASMGVIWVYALMTGLSASIFRAAVMFTFVAAEGAMGRKTLSFQSLWAALLTISLVDPRAVWSVGLWLSFAAVGALVATNPLMRSALAGKGRIATAFYGSLWVSVVAQVATMPILAYTFHTFPVYFWANNLVIMWPIEIIFIGTMLCTAVAWIPYVGSAIGWGIDTLLGLLTQYCQWAAHLPGATIEGLRPTAAEFGALTVCVAMTIYASRDIRGRWRGLVTVGVVCVGVIIASESTREFKRGEMFDYKGVVGAARSNESGEAEFWVADGRHPQVGRVVKSICEKNGWHVVRIHQMKGVEILDIEGERVCFINDPDAVVETDGMRVVENF